MQRPWLAALASALFLSLMPGRAEAAAVAPGDVLKAQPFAWKNNFDNRSDGDYDEYAITMSPGRTYVIQTSDAGGGDTFLYLMNPDGSVAAQNHDDTDNDTSGSLIEFPPPAAGTYTIRLRAADQGGSGNCTLSVDSFPYHSGRALLPDLISWKKPGAYLYDARVIHGNGQKQLTFTNTTVNVGDGPLEMFAVLRPDGSEIAYQRIYNADGNFTDRRVATFDFPADAGFDSLHFKDFIDYNLRQVTPAGGIGNVVASAQKVVYGVADDVQYDHDVPAAPRDPAYPNGNMGLSPGWGDVYDVDSQGQFIDVSSLNDGTYWLEAVEDPQSLLQKVGAANNVSRLKIAIRGDNVTILGDDSGLPTLTSIQPVSVPAGSPGFALRALGSGFASGAVVQWNGAGRPTTVVSSASLSAQIAAEDVASTGAARVSVLNPGPQGGPSAARAFSITAREPVDVGTAPASGSVLLFDSFGAQDGLVTNEYAYFNPSDPAAVQSSTWQVASGSLFASGGQAWTGVPDDGTPNPGSTNATGSSTFRLLTRRSNFGDVTVSFMLQNVGLGASATTPAAAGDGVGIVLRWQGPGSQYRVAANRRDGTVAIQKAAPSGTTTAWTSLAAARYAVPYGSLQAVQASARNDPDGSVILELAIGGQTIVRAVDDGVGGPPLRNPGKTGLAGDNDELKFDAFTVKALGGSQNAVPPPAQAGPTEARAFPNPWRADRHAGLALQFAPLQAGATVKIFTVSGRFVRSLSPVNGGAAWDLNDGSGDPVASGYYLFLVIAPDGGHSRGTLVVIR